MAIIECEAKNLPRDLDVAVSVTRRTFETETDLSIAVCVLQDGPFRHGAERIAYYTDATSVNDDWAVGSEGRKAARDFASQPGRAKTFALAQAFTTAQPGYAKYGALPTLATMQAVTDGSFTIAIDGVSNNITGLDFSGDTDFDDVAATIQTAVRAIASGGFTNATVVVESSRLIVTSGTTGAASSVSVLGSVDPSTGTDISGESFLNGTTATRTAGYTPSGLEGELDLIEEAARCSGKFIYGWDLDERYRDTADQVTFANWVRARTAIGTIISNNALATDAGSTSDVGVTVQALGSSRLHVGYHDQEAYYPGMAVLAQMLGINYNEEKAVRTAKFLELEGIPTVPLSVTQWNTLKSKGYNVNTATGNASRVYREGINSNTPIWYLDQRITLDNYAEKLSVELFNLLKTGKLGINAEGQTQEQDAIDTVNELYVFNGAFSARRQAAPNTREGYVEVPPYQTTLAPLELHTTSERAERNMTPAVVNVNLTDFAHTISVSVRA